MNSQKRETVRTYPGARILARLIFLVCATTQVSVAQPSVPIGEWRVHISYNAIHHVVSGENKIFGSTESGILVFDKSDQSLTTLNTLNGLSATGITAIAYDNATEQLLVAYQDGNIDIITDNTALNFSRLQNASGITGSKRINHIAIHQGLAYLSTDYGIVVFNIQQRELKETWRDLGPSGLNLKIHQTTFLNDTIFAATENGIISGHLHDNLLDYNHWSRFNSGDLNGPVRSIAAFNNTVFAAIDGNGIYRHDNASWAKEPFLQGTSFSFVNASGNHLLIGAGQTLYRLDSSGQLISVPSNLFSQPLAAVEDVSGKLWIGDNRNGLVSDLTGTFTSYLPNGPSVAANSALRYHNKTLYAVAGGFSAAGEPLGMPGVVNAYHDGTWGSYATITRDLTDVTTLNEQLYLASFGDGVERTDLNASGFVFDHTNSPLQNVDAPQKSVYVTALAPSVDGLWVANYGALQPLHLLNGDNWESYSIPYPQARFATRLAIDFTNTVWMVIDPAKEGGIITFNREKNQARYLSSLTGSGALPSAAVHAITRDRDGYMWVGTDEGVAYFFSSGDEAIKPVFEGRFLLRDEKVTAIKVDGGNRKWMGTDKGVWLFSADGEKLIHHFSTENSPLLSNNIDDIEINDETGEVFFATQNGIVSFQSDASASDSGFKHLQIFPNPVSADFAGTVGIRGLATDAIVKITDANGRLIWQTQANGGTATWNVRDANGRRAVTGIYLVFSATEDGSESVVGKIAVID
jgi:hypothetical protein